MRFMGLKRDDIYEAGPNNIASLSTSGQLLGQASHLSVHLIEFCVEST